MADFVKECEPKLVIGQVSEAQREQRPVGCYQLGRTAGHTARWCPRYYYGHAVTGAQCHQLGQEYGRAFLLML